MRAMNDVLPTAPSPITTQWSEGREAGGATSSSAEAIVRGEEAAVVVAAGGRERRREGLESQGTEESKSAKGPGHGEGCKARVEPAARDSGLPLAPAAARGTTSSCAVVLASCCCWLLLFARRALSRVVSASARGERHLHRHRHRHRHYD